MKLSIIVPCKNEGENVKKLYEKVNEVFNKTKYEIIFIDDGSNDNTLFNLKELYNLDKKHVRVLSFSRNFKKDSAMYAGLVYSKGEYTCFLDADLQQNPKYVKDMVDFLDNNSEYDQVAMVRENRKSENIFVAFCKNMFYKLIDKISYVHFEKDASDFRVFRRNVKDAILNLTEVNRFTKGIFSYVGFNIKYMEYEVEDRKYGSSSFGFVESVKYALNGIVNFSSKPLVIPLFLGYIMIFCSLLYFVISIFSLTINELILFLLILFSGIQFVLIGIIGKYISNIQIEVKNRPSYIIKEKIGFEEEV